VKCSRPERIRRSGRLDRGFVAGHSQFLVKRNWTNQSALHPVLESTPVGGVGIDVARGVAVEVAAGGGIHQALLSVDATTYEGRTVGRGAEAALAVIGAAKQRAATKAPKAPAMRRFMGYSS
jgi:hypothetical protein